MPALDAETVSDIEQTVLDRGSLTKEEIQSLWPITADAEVYSALKATLLSRRRVEPGSPRGGGFTAKASRRAGEGDEETGAPLRLEEWEKQAIERLSELLGHGEIEKLLGDLTYTVRQSRVARGEADRRGSKAELAAALIIQHGVDLFAEKDIRDAVARRCRVLSPGRWHPGKLGAVDFVSSVGMPRELAGLLKEESRPAFEFLEGRFRLHPLQDFQQEVSDKLRKGLAEPGHRSIVTLPTGGGKTRVAVEAIRDWLLEKYNPESSTADQAAVLWLAHTEELCEQAYSCFRQVWEGSESVAPLLLARFWGNYMGDLISHRATLRRVIECPSVLISTPQRIVNILQGVAPGSEAVVTDLRAALGLLVVDEAHRAAAPSYRTIISRIVPLERPVPVVGLTATPFRTEYVDPMSGTAALREIFRNLIEPVDTLGHDVRATLQERGVLARPVFERIETGTALRMPVVPDGGDPSQDTLDSIDRALAIHADKPSRRIVVLNRIAPLAENPENLILYFGPSVRDAECMAYLLRERGIAAAVVSGKTREASRRRLVGKFRRGEIRVLCNCEVLTTGFDAPKVTHVVMARPTVSQVLYEQMVGRGLRGERFGGTATCVILDCEDNVKGAERPELGYKAFRRVWLRETTPEPPAQRSFI